MINEGLDDLLDFEPLVSYDNRGSDVIRKVEEKICQSINKYNPLLVTSGTSALYLTLVASQFEPNSEIIFPVNICHSMVDAAIRANLIPVFADVNEDLFVDLDILKKVITANTRAVVLVHPFGMPIDLENYYTYCHSKNVLLIEDCAQSIFSRLNNKMVGQTGDISIYSFGQNKPISAGGGGVVCAKDKSFAEKLRGIAKDGCINGIPHKYMGLGLFVNDLHGEYIYNRLCHVETLKNNKQDKVNCYLSEFNDMFLYIGKELQDKEGYHNTFHRLVLKIPNTDVSLLLNDLTNKYGHIVKNLSQNSYPYIPFNSNYIQEYYKQKNRVDLIKNSDFSSYLKNASHYLYLFTHERINKESILEYSRILKEELKK